MQRLAKLSPLMADVPPDLAAKVLQAEVRNHAKKVGEGSTLSSADRHLFIGFAVGSDAEKMIETRTDALLTKWLFGGRLSKEERAEIQHVLPADGPRRVSKEQYQRSPDDYGHIAIERRTFFRWKKAGEANAGGPDLPPFDQPEHLESWYERMRARGVFKHRFPKTIRDAIDLLAIKPAPPSVPSAAPSVPINPAKEPADSVPDSFKGDVDHGAAIGMAYEILQEEKRIASLRVARDAAYEKGDRTEGDACDRRFRESFNEFTSTKKRAIEILEKEKALVSRADVKQDLAARITGIVVGGMFLYQRIAPLMDAELEAGARTRIWKKAWQEHCSPLMQCQYAPDFLTAMKFEMWEECARWLESQAPPPLQLT